MTEREAREARARRLAEAVLAHVEDPVRRAAAVEVIVAELLTDDDEQEAKAA